MDLSKLTLGDKVIAGSAIALFIFSFFPWFTVELDGGGFFEGAVADGNGWDVGFLFGAIPVLLGLAMLAYVVISRFAEQVELPEAPWSRILLGFGVAAGALVLLKLIIGESDEGIPGLSVTRAIGMYLSTLAALGLAAGGFLKFKEGEEGTAAAGPPTSF